jgi:hypothetical protein
MAENQEANGEAGQAAAAEGAGLTFAGADEYFPTTFQSPKPLRTTKVTWEQLRMLAYAPRKGFSAFGWAAASGVFGSVSAASQDIYAAFFRDDSVPIEAGQLGPKPNKSVAV